MFRFITNFLEPLAYLLYFIAVFLYNRRQPSTSLCVLLLYYAGGVLLLSYGSLHVLFKGQYFLFSKSKNNIWVYDLVALLGAVCIGIYFHRILQTRLKKNLVLTLTALYLGYALFRNITLNEVRLFDSIGYSIVSASVAVYVFMYFHQLLKNVSASSILSEFNFWLASCYLVYFVGSFIIFLSYYYFTVQALEHFKISGSSTQKERDLLNALWGVHNVLLFITAVTLLLGSLWIAYRKKSA